MPAKQQAVDVAYYNMRTVFQFIFILTISFIPITSFGQIHHDFLQRVVGTSKDTYGYVNSKGDTIIPLNKYLVCYTEKFYDFAIVSTRGKGIIGIDRKENMLFNVYVFDNGPDYLSNRLFRIVKNGKIGYADKTGHVIISPQFDCAYPFKNGKAKVGNGCMTKTDGEHSTWTGGQWRTIDKKGNIIN